MKTFTARTIDILNGIEDDWRSSGLFPLTQPGEFDWNNAHTIERISETELHVTTTDGSELRWIVKA